MARRSTDPEGLAHAIADELSQDDYHGTFDLFASGDRWHHYRATFDTEYDLAAIPELANPFGQWLPRYYDGLGQVFIELVIQNEQGEAVAHEWRSLGRRVGADASLDPEYVDGKTREWQLGINYRSDLTRVTGIEVQLEAGSNYRNGKLYQLMG